VTENYEFRIDNFNNGCANYLGLQLRYYIINVVLPTVIVLTSSFLKHSEPTDIHFFNPFSGFLIGKWGIHLIFGLGWYSKKKLSWSIETLTRQLHVDPEENNESVKSRGQCTVQ
jgi:hypothetical protein